MQQHHICVERDDRTDAHVAVDGQDTAVEQDPSEAEARQVLGERAPQRPRIVLLDVRPPQIGGSRGEFAQLALLRRESLHHPHALDVLVDDRGDLGLATLHDPAHRERDVPQLRAGEVGERQRRNGDQGQADMDRQHESQRDDEAHQVERDQRCEGEEHLHRTDVGVRSRDQLAGLNTVVEREVEPGEVTEHRRPQIALEVVRDGVERGPVPIGEGGSNDRERSQHPDEVLDVASALTQTLIDRAHGDPRDQHAGHHRDQRADERSEETEPLRCQQRPHPPQPAVVDVRIDHRTRCRSIGPFAHAVRLEARPRAVRIHRGRHYARPIRRRCACR